MVKNFSKEIKGFFGILPFGIIVFLIYCIVEWVDFNTILTQQKRFALESVILLADSFLVNAVVVFFLPILLSAGHIKPTFNQAFKKSFIYLPKVILSYFVLMLFTQFAFEISQSSPIPALIMLVFFIWAPYFVAFEQFADQSVAEDEDDDEGFDPFDEQMITEKPKTAFSKKSSFHLGFIRSLDFTSKNASLSVSIVFVLWLIKVIPELFIGLSLDVNTSFLAIVVQIAASCIGAVFINMYITSSFFRGLEPNQRLELYGTSSEEEKKFAPEIMITSPNGVRVAILCLMVIFTTGIWSEQKIQLRSFPEGLSFKINELSKKENEILMKLEMVDQKSKFRWFDPKKFRFFEPELNVKPKKEEPDSASGKPKEKPSISPLLDDPKSPFAPIIKMLGEKLVPPSRVVIYDDKGKLVGDRQYSPREGPLKMTLVFPLKRSKNNSSKTLYEFSYVNPFGLKQVLMTFTEESLSGLVGKTITP